MNEIVHKFVPDGWHIYEIIAVLISIVLLSILIEEVVALFWRERSTRLTLVVLVMNFLTLLAVLMLAIVMQGYVDQYFEEHVDPAIHEFLYLPENISARYHLLCRSLLFLLLFVSWFIKWIILTLTEAAANKKRAAFMSLTLNACSLPIALFLISKVWGMYYISEWYFSLLMVLHR